jgi:hypothetical protein
MVSIPDARRVMRCIRIVDHPVKRIENLLHSNLAANLQLANQRS